MKPGNYIIIKGDATLPEVGNARECPIVLIPHICNDIGEWGAGFVLALNKRFGHLPMAEYKNFLTSLVAIQHPDTINSTNMAAQLGDYQFVLGKILSFGGRVERQSRYVVNMIAQEGCGFADGAPPIRYDALAKAMHGIASYVVHKKQASGDWGKVEFHCPKFGCGLAGGDWYVISGLIENIWVRRGFNVTVYEFNGE